MCTKSLPWSSRSRGFLRINSVVAAQPVSRYHQLTHLPTIIYVHIHPSSPLNSTSLTACQVRSTYVWPMTKQAMHMSRVVVVVVVVVVGIAILSSPNPFHFNALHSISDINPASPASTATQQSMITTRRARDASPTPPPSQSLTLTLSDEMMDAWGEKKEEKNHHRVNTASQPASFPDPSNPPKCLTTYLYYHHPLLPRRKQKPSHLPQLVTRLIHKPVGPPKTFS